MNPSPRNPRSLVRLLAAFVAVAVAAPALVDTGPVDTAHAARPTSTTRSGSAGPAPCASPVEPTGPEPTAYAAYHGPRQHEDCRTVADTAKAGFDFGELVDPPPVTERPADKGVDVIAHWYNDFGLDSTLTGTNWNGWYDWRWNFPTNTGDGERTFGYDPARHPLLGFYKGDDPRALGWIAYWLASAGVTAVSLPTNKGFTTDGWEGSWTQRLLEETPNAAALRVVLGLGSSGSAASIEERSVSLVDFIARNPAFAHVVERDGGRYVSVNVWDLEALRGVLDRYNGGSQTRAFLARVAERFRAIGYDGVALHAQRAGLLGADDVRAWILEETGVLLLPSSYEGRYLGSSLEDYASYADRVDYDAVATSDTVLGVFTSADSAYPHPSGLRIPGSSPELFRRQLEDATRYVVDHDLPRLISVYNVSEWAEGGPGLVPQHRDGYGYLEAIRTMPAYPRP